MPSNRYVTSDRKAPASLSFTEKSTFDEFDFFNKMAKILEFINLKSIGVSHLFGRTSGTAKQSLCIFV